MKFKELFTKTLRNYPKDETAKNAQLLIQAGFINKTMAGVYSFLPLGLRVLNKVENIVRKHLNSIGGQEITMNSLHPKSFWEYTGRWDSVDVLFKLTSQTNNEYALAPTHEEQISPIMKEYISSWKDLPEYDPANQQFPLSVYQIQTKFRDETRSKGGLMRGREFIMKDLYDFHRSEESMNKYYDAIMQKYLDIYENLGIDAYVVRASGGSFTKFSHEFQAITSTGEDWTVIWSDDTKDNLEIAKGYPLDTYSISNGEKIYRENLLDNVKTVADHAKNSGLTNDRILKSVFFVTEEQVPRYIGVVIRGDLEVSEELVLQILDKSVRAGKDEELEKIGSQRGRFSPIKEIANSYTQKITWIFDKSIIQAKSMVSSYYINVDVDRDLVVPDYIGCVSVVKKGFAREDSNEVILKDIVRSAEVGNIFKLGNRWTKAFEIKYLDQDNQLHYPIMGCYGIGITRCIGVIAETNNDENGLIWPENVAPFKYHLITHYNSKEEQHVIEEVLKTANKIYSGQDERYEKDEIIWDDRDVSIGEKLKDADLIGCPYQLIITPRNIANNQIEIKDRRTGQKNLISLN
jgi:prolyl-tRNA synthetase